MTTADFCIPEHSYERVLKSWGEDGKSAPILLPSLW